jgi:hypothetical protein
VECLTLEDERTTLFRNVCRGSSVGTATRYGLDGPRIESRWRRDFPHPSRPALRPTQPPIHRVPAALPGVKRPGRGVDHLAHVAPRLKEEQIYTPTRSLSLSLGLVACTRVTFTFTFTLFRNVGKNSQKHGATFQKDVEAQPHCCDNFVCRTKPLILCQRMS